LAEIFIFSLIGSTCHNIKINFGEIEWGGMDWINLDQDRKQWWALANTITFLLVQ
jgi:hypothetical protein